MKQLLSAVVLVVAIVASRADAQTIERIAAIVNDEVISAYDVHQRIGLVIATSGLPDTQETRARLQDQVVRNLIDERLQMQEALRLNIRVSTEELRRAVGLIEQQNNLAPGSLSEFLTRRGIDFQTLLGQLSTSIAWSKLVQRRLLPSIEVSDEEVRRVLERLEENVGKREYRVAEIFLAVDSPEQEPEVRQNAARLVEQIRLGARFDALARQFSQGTTSAAGGEIGWIQPGQLPTELDEVLATMEPGQVSTPIRAPGGYYIMALLDRREIGTADYSAVEVELAQLLFSTREVNGAASMREQLSQAALAREQLNTCADLERVAPQFASAEAGMLGRIKLGDLPAPIRSTLQNLEVGEPSEPIRTEAGFHIFMICDRVGDVVTEGPTQESIRAELTERRLTLLSRRYLRDLRRDAIVEFR